MTDGCLEVTALNPASLLVGFTLIEPRLHQLEPAINVVFQSRLNATAGTSRGRFSFANNDGDENPFDITLTGRFRPPRSPYCLQEAI